MSTPRPAEERAFLQSVVYAALFEYPLTVSQLREALIGTVADEATLLRWFAESTYLQQTIEYESGYFFPRGRHELLATRSRREAISQALLQELQGPLRLITGMPFVRMVALSGSLAHRNADADADLDLFVITSPHRVWTVTVATLICARLMRWRRRLCLNYVVSERALWIAPADLFSANQIVHLQPLSGATTYRRFLKANRFVGRFYPNFNGRQAPSARMPRSFQTSLEFLHNVTIGPLVEYLCRALYRMHLQRQAHTWSSRDQVRLDAECLKLHTHSHRRTVMERFERALDDVVAGPEQDGMTPRFTREESHRLQASL
jgi:hypothetical protein